MLIGILGGATFACIHDGAERGHFFLYPAGPNFTFPQIILEHESNLEYYKNIFPLAKVQRGQCFLILKIILCLGTRMASERLAAAGYCDAFLEMLLIISERTSNRLERYKHITYVTA